MLYAPGAPPLRLPGPSADQNDTADSGPSTPKPRPAKNPLASSSVPMAAAPRGPRPVAERDKDMALHGIAVMQATRCRGCGCERGPARLFRLTPLSPMELSEPARANARPVTQHSRTGTHTPSTLDSWATGKTPWAPF